MIAHIGGRYTMILGLTIFTACFFWQAGAQSYDSLLAARVVGGLGGGVVESMGPMIVVMLFPQECIGRAMSVYTWALGGGTVFGPLFAGYMIEGLGSWRYPQYLFGAMSALNLIGCIVVFPEPLVNIRMAGEPPLPAVSAAIMETDGLRMHSLKGTSQSGHQEVEATPPVMDTPPTSWRSLWLRRSFFVRFSHHHPVDGWLPMLGSPYRLLATPAVLVTVLAFGVTISTTIAISILVSLTFAQPPLLWSTGTIGLYNISVLVGLCAGIPIGGVLADGFHTRFRKRNGYHKPEAAMPLLVPLAVTTPLAIALIGNGLAKQWHWAATGVLWAVININLTGGCTVLISYATDIYPEKAVDVGVVVNVVKNAIAAGVSFAAVDWWTKDGWYMFLALALIELCIFIFMIPLYLYGSKITAMTKSWTWLQGYDVE